MEIKHQQLNLLYSNTPLAIIGNFIAVSIIILILFGNVPEISLVIWSTMILLILFIRSISLYQYKKNQQQSSINCNLNLWLKLQQASAFITGSLWGSSTYFADYFHSIDYLLMMAAAGFILAGSAIVTLGAMFSTYLAYSLPMLSIIAISMFTSNGTAHFECGILVLLGIIFTTISAYRYSKNSHDILVRTYEIKQAKEIILQQNNFLEQKVKKRSQQLLIARDDAIKANKLKSEFLAKISHEIRTPMHGVISFANMGINRSEKLTSEQNLKYFSNIKKSAMRLMGLINDLLDLAKLESGKMKMDYQQSSLLKITENCLAEQQIRLENLVIEVCIHPNSITENSFFDPLKISEVVSNCLSNAIKYSPKGTTIEIVILSTEIKNIKQQPIPAIQFSIHDYGIGIPDNEFELIFDNYIQCNSKVNDENKGTGLGLAICKKIISLHSGNIWAENHPEGGAIFSFVIPINQELN
ncbi:MAG: ATP-binding protein [Pseudomonadota bacterium]